MRTPGGTSRYVGEAWLGFVAVATAGLGLAFGFGAPAELGMAGIVLGLGAAPSLLLVALASWAVRSRLLPAPRAMAAAVLGVLACAAGTLAAASWSVGFALADDLRPATPTAELFADLFLAFLGTNWLLGAAAIFTALVALPGRASLSRARRTILAGLVAVLAAPAIGMSFVAPVTPVLASIAVTVLLLFAGARSAAPRPAAASGTAAEPTEGCAPVGAAPVGPAPVGRPPVGPAPVGPAPVGPAPAALAWLSAGLGAGAVAFALSGSRWPSLGRGLDETSAMGWGIAAGLVGALPLLVAVAIAADRRRTNHTPRWAAFGPAALLAGAFVAAAAFSAGNALTAGAGSAVGWILAALGLLLYGLAIALAAFARLPLAGPGRAATAALIGLGGTVLTGAALFLVAFASPVLAVLAAVVFPRLNRPRRALGPVSPDIA